ncbi:MAG TPA: DUF1489 domain-containing protein [Rhizomicrobium sp.]|nr:DUF1489 domain-containing protein [Rhizomicrobium sp.]
MSLHLIKLCVGVNSLADLAQWQKERTAELRKKKKPLELMHLTRQTPKRADELLDGGSLYWVIKGHIAARQRLIDLRAASKNGVPHCAIVYEPTLVATARRTHRPFQGWRYLNDKDAPADLRDVKGGKGLPEALKAELAELGLL